MSETVPLTTAETIIRWHGKKPQGFRPHLGASLIGVDCLRAIWYSFRWAQRPSFDGRMIRLFETGSLAENRFIKELRSIGIEVHDREGEDQIRVSAFDGHFGGSLDGIGFNFPESPQEPCVIEFKTHNAKSFAQLSKDGVAKSKPQHYAQMNIYMGLTGIEKAMYIASCKDTDSIYSELVELDMDVFNGLMEKARAVITSKEPPAKISDDINSFGCKFCDYKDMCHGTKVGLANCRTCCHSSPVEDASWHCELNKQSLTKEAQESGCKQHLFIPGLIPYASPVDGGENYIVYQNSANGKEFTNGCGKGQYLSFELQELDPQMVGDAFVDDMKNELNVVAVSETTFMDALDQMATSAEEINSWSSNPKIKPVRKRNGR